MTADTAKPEAPSVAALKKTLLYERSTDISSLVGDLREFSRFDKVVESRQKFWVILTIIVLIASITCLAMNLSYAAALGFAALFFSVYKATSWARFNLANERYLLAEQLLELFGRDLDESVPVSLRLHFDKVIKKENVIKADGLRTRYKHNWLTLSGRLIDGSKFSCRVAEMVHVKRRKGKVKAKGYALSLSLSFSRKRWGELKCTNERSGSLIKLPAQTYLKSCKIRGNVLHMNAKLEAQFGKKAPQLAEILSQGITMLLLSGYEILHSGQSRSESSAS
ncbi:MAG: hypothetical protein K2X27_07110 [Candidatus Obscuribacterales bacterium]|nr:hypothetical protein [Candidatus Obscuribacterales bacterium]